MRILSEEKLATLLGSLPGEPRVVTGGNFATPWRALTVLDAVVERYRLYVLNGQPGLPDRDGVTPESSFVGAGMRGNPRLKYFPCRLSLVPYLLAQHLPPDVVLVQVSRPVHDTVSLGVEVNILPSAIEAARASGGLVIAQINPKMPYTYGDAVLASADIDYAIEADEWLLSPARRPSSEVHQRIGELVAGIVPNGATLQLGIGGIPDVVLNELATRRELRIWSEMFSDGVLELERAGVLDDDSLITASFAFGSAELYSWVDGNQRVQMLRTEKTNDPGLIARQHSLFSINSALQVDLFAQANASWVNGKIYSGFGGQPDFVAGALHSRGGHAIIALPSWHPKAEVSTTVPRLTGTVTSFQHSYVVSENGVARIWGRDAADQAGEIISNVAHPAARDELHRAARAAGLAIAPG